MKMGILIFKNSNPGQKKKQGNSGLWFLIFFGMRDMIL